MEESKGSPNIEPIIIYDGSETVTVTFSENLEKSRYGDDDYSITIGHDYGEEEYNDYGENKFVAVKQEPLSTFSIDVDTASYSNIRRMILDGMRPPEEAVRIEEMINYFSYDYEEPKRNEAFSVNTEFAECPWNEDHYLAMVGIKGKEELSRNVKSNLVFLIDVSGSMDEPNKLPLLRSGFKMMVDQLTKNDRVSIVVYAGRSGVVLDGGRGDEKDYIKDKLNELRAGGSTAGAEGIEMAYRLAEEHFIKDGNNRVILATDGDFNVGPSSEDELNRIIEEKRESGIFLSVLGFGTGNYKDNKMEQLADKGNGNYYYLDTLYEAKKVLVDDLNGMLFAIAKDVKIQVEFNPANVLEYRLIGYENRMLNKEDFNDDTVDAGELGAGHTVTALYEIVPADGKSTGTVDGLKYQDEENPVKEMFSGEFKDEWFQVKLRYKKPDEDQSTKIVKVVKEKDFRKNPSPAFDFASAVAEFGMILKDVSYQGDASLDNLLDRAEEATGGDDYGYRLEFVNLVEIYRSIRD